MKTREVNNSGSSGHVRRMDDAGLTVSSCRWIEGDDMRTPDYCGDPIKPGSSYCATHHARCYLASVKRTEPRNFTFGRK